MSLLPFYRCIGIRAAGHKTMFGEKRSLLVLWLLVQTEFNFVAIHATAAAGEPCGLNAMAQFDRLPYLKLDTMAAGQSSFDRSGGNADAGNFLYVDGTNKVLLDLQGPGTVYRMWFTGFDPAADYIQVYFDGEATPRINMLLNDLFSGTNAPFLSPLVGNEAVSSGGYFCYLPLPFKKSIKIVSNGTSTTFYYNIGYHVYSPDTSVTTWTGAEDSSTVRNLWNNAGLDPKSDVGNMVVSNTIDLAAGAAQTLLDVAGPRSISAIKLRIPGIGPSLPQTVTDNGPGGYELQPVQNEPEFKQLWRRAGPEAGLRNRQSEGQCFCGRRAGGAMVRRGRGRRLPMARRQFQHSLKLHRRQKLDHGKGGIRKFVTGLERILLLDLFHRWRDERADRFIERGKFRLGKRPQLCYQFTNLVGYADVPISTGRTVNQHLGPAYEFVAGGIL